jgi:DNA-binding CsgD family transcriptional regulator
MTAGLTSQPMTRTKAALAPIALVGLLGATLLAGGMLGAAVASELDSFNANGRIAQVNATASSLESQALIQFRAGERESAAQAAAADASLVSQALMQFRAGERESLPLCEADASRVEGDAAPAMWSRAAAAFAALPMPYQQAYARWREAGSPLTARQPRAPANTALFEAHGIATRLGAQPLRRQIEATAQRARIDLSGDLHATAKKAKPAAKFGLTARELEVLQLLVAGRMNRDIAKTLFITENTAGVHVSNILGKLGVARRTEAAAIAHELGLVEGIKNG